MFVTQPHSLHLSCRMPPKKCQATQCTHESLCPTCLLARKIRDCHCSSDPLCDQCIVDIKAVQRQRKAVSLKTAKVRKLLADFPQRLLVKLGVSTPEQPQSLVECMDLVESLMVQNEKKTVGSVSAVSAPLAASSLSVAASSVGSKPAFASKRRIPVADSVSGSSLTLASGSSAVASVSLAESPSPTVVVDDDDVIFVGKDSTGPKGPIQPPKRLRSASAISSSQ